MSTLRNLIVVGGIAALAAGYGGYQYVQSDAYAYGQMLKQAESASDAGNLTEALTLYKEVYSDSESRRADAGAGIRSMLTTTRLSDLSTPELARTVDLLSDFDVMPLSNPERIHSLVRERLAAADVSKNDVSENIALHTLVRALQDLEPDGEDLSDVRQRLIEVIFAADPTNLDAAIGMAEAPFEDGDAEATKVILEPIKGTLADSEGARMLGQIYLSEGRTADAYPLLSDYTRARLARFKEAEAEVIRLQNTIWEQEIDALSRGDGPQSFYNEYNSITPEEQQVLVDNYVVQKMESDAWYTAAIENYRDAAAIVPVALDFGVLQLRNAESLTDEAARDAELKAAEETFLSIQNVAGDSDDYKLYLGQVYFWLGRQDEGQALFDDLLRANQRAPQALLSVGSTLRTLGKVELAEELYEEAYNSSEERVLRSEAAYMLSLISTTLEDSVIWLERSDTTLPYVQVSLKESQGHLAAQKGQTREAIALYREAIDLSNALPMSTSSYNNTALIHFALHRLTGDKGDYAQGADLMSKAVEISPDDGIVLSNAATTLITKSLYDTVESNIDFTTLRETPSIQNFGYFYENEDEKSVLRDKLAANADFQRAIDYFDRAILLSPNNPTNYRELSQIYYSLKQPEALAALTTKMVENRIDISQSRQSVIDFAAGVDRDKNLSRLKESEAFEVTLLEQRHNAETRGALHLSLARNYLAQTAYGDKGSAAKALDQAEKAVDNLPSSATRTTLTTALITQASLEAAEQFPAYADLREAALNSISDETLVNLTLLQSSDVSDWLKSNQLIQRATGIEEQDRSRFPESYSYTGWVLLNASGSQEAETLKATLTDSDMIKSLREMAYIMAPLSGEGLASDYIHALIVDAETFDRKRLNELSEAGIELPRELFP